MSGETLRRPVNGCPVTGAATATPSVGTLALSWPPIDKMCDFPHPDPTPAVVEGWAYGDEDSGAPVEAVCLHHAAAGGIVAADGRDVPSLSELDVAQQLAAHRAGRNVVPGQIDPALVDLGNITGLPRPMVEVETSGGSKKYPHPWINGHYGISGDYYTFREESLVAFEDRLCCICGTGLEGAVALAALQGRRETSGGWGHPRCIMIAVRTCPHFTDQFPDDGQVACPRFDTVAWRWDGPGVGVDRPEMSEDQVDLDAAPLSWEELKAWARSDPFGTRRGGIEPVPPTSST